MIFPPVQLASFTHYNSHLMSLVLTRAILSPDYDSTCEILAPCHTLTVVSPLLYYHISIPCMPLQYHISALVISARISQPPLYGLLALSIVK